LGLGDIIQRLRPTQISCGTRSTMLIDWSVKTDREEFHSSDNDIWICGANYNGQLGLDDTQHRNIFTQIPNIKAKKVVGGCHHTGIIDLEDNIWVCGNNSYGQLGFSNNQNRQILIKIENFKARDIAMGYCHTIIIGTNY